MLAEIQKGSAAQKAGLQVGDRIVKVNGIPIRGWRDFALQIHDNPGHALALDIERAGLPVSLALTPESRGGARADRRLCRRGSAGDPATGGVSNHSPVWAVHGTVSGDRQDPQLMRLTVSMLGKLITGDVKLNNLGGPISIAQGAGRRLSMAWCIT